MDYLQQLCDAARTPASQYLVERPYAIAIAVLIVVFFHYLFMSTVWFRLLVSWRRPLARLLQCDLFHWYSPYCQRPPRVAVAEPKWRDRGVLLPSGLGDVLCESLENGVIKSPRRTYVMGDRLPGGDLCDVYLTVSRGRRFVVKITKVSAGNHLLLKEDAIVGQLAALGGDHLYRQYLPWCVDNFALHDKRAIVFLWRTDFLDAVSMMRPYPQGVDGQHVAWIFSRLLNVLGHVHEHGWVHGGVLPPHLLLHTGQRGLQLLGWIHAERRGEILQLVSTRYKSWYPPECHARRGVTPATDIYLAAKCMQWLAGGNPLSSLIPDYIPHSMRQCLQKCLAGDPALRPQNAWVLQHQVLDISKSLDTPKSPTFVLPAK